MVCLSAVLFIVFTSGVLSEDLLLTPCGIQDTQCLIKTTGEFLEHTSQGIPEYDIRAIDPLYIPSLDYVMIENPNVKIHLRNISVMGLKNQRFSDFKMDTKTKKVNLQTEADIYASSDIVVELENSRKFSGTYAINGTVLGTAKYGYDFKVDGKGIEHYEVGPETITCEAVAEPKVILNSDLEKDLRNDKVIIELDLKSKLNSSLTAFRSKQICQIVNVAYVTVVHNIRAAAKILPKDAFLKGV